MTTASNVSVRICEVRTSGGLAAGDLRCLQGFSSFLLDSPYSVEPLKSDNPASRDLAIYNCLYSWRPDRDCNALRASSAYMLWGRVCARRKI